MQTTPQEQPKSAPTSQPPVETGCCPRFDPGPWQEQEFHWKDRPFIKQHVRALLHVPLGLDKLYREEQAVIAAAEARSSDDLVLSDETSLWGADYYFAVSKNVPGAKMTSLSGTYLSKVFEGPYNHIGKWLREMRDFVASRGLPVEHLYFWYTTCPKCAKVYGKNPVVLFAKVG